MTGESRKSAPQIVVVLGWLWIVPALGLLLWSLGLVFVFGVVSNFTPGGLDGMPAAPPVARPISLALQHYVTTGTVLGALALFCIYAGARFLRLERWARAFLEAGGWAAIALSVIFGLWLSQFWALGLGDDALTAAANVIMIFVGIVYRATFPAVFVWLLRSRWVRPAFAREAPAPGPAA